MIKRIILIAILIVVLAFVVHWTGIPIGTLIDEFLDNVFSWTNGMIPKLTDLVPKLGEWVNDKVSAIASSL